MSDSREHVPGTKRWQFDAEVTEVFDDMLARSIPQFEIMRAACVDVVRQFAQSHTEVLDIGCSRGGALAAVKEAIPDIIGLGLEVSPPMLEAARARFQGDDSVRIVSHDLRQSLPVRDESFDVVLCVLTLQFTPIEYRQQIVSECRRALRPGGALVLVEKVLGTSSRIDRVLVDAYLDLKTRNGYDDDKIARKRAALEGVLVPVTAQMNEMFLRHEQFLDVECFWRAWNFAGWIAIR